MKFKPVDFWGTEQKKKKKPTRKLCPHCGCDIKEMHGYVHTTSGASVYGLFDGVNYRDEDIDYHMPICYSCPDCSGDLGENEDEVSKYLE